jgi:hypothetical protein
VPVSGVLETSAQIAGNHGRPLDCERRPEEAAIRVVSLTELEGVQVVRV